MTTPYEIADQLGESHIELLKALDRKTATGPSISKLNVLTTCLPEMSKPAIMAYVSELDAFHITDRLSGRLKGLVTPPTAYTSTNDITVFGRAVIDELKRRRAF